MTPIDYDENYFHATDGAAHPAGYTNYSRLYWTNINDQLDQGEEFKTRHLKFYNRYTSLLAGKKVLEIGCAYGFMVDDLQALGVDITGIDVSSHARTRARSGILNRVSVADARTALVNTPRNTYDVVITSRMLPCLTDLELIPFMTRIKLISRAQIHIVDDTASYDNTEDPDNPDEPTDLERVSEYYNMKSIQEWETIATITGRVESSLLWVR